MPLVKGEVVAKTTAPSAPAPSPDVGFRQTPIKAPAGATPPATPIKAPTEPHEPALANIGFNGGINEFNQRVHQLHNTFVQIHGYEPTPGLVLDIARSPVPPEQFPLLFQAPSTANDARNAAAVAQHQQENPHDWFVTRPDGIMQARTPFTQMLNATTPPAATATPDAQLPQPKLLKKYPMVTMGVLPIPSANALYGAVSYLNARGPQAVSGDQNFTDAVKNPPSFDTYKLHGGSLLGDVGAVTNIKQAQQELNQAMNTTLPVTGTMNTSWLSAIHNWMHSSDYVLKTLKYQSHQAGFGDNIDAYKAAWEQKQRASKSGLVGHFLETMPLPLFGHGGLWDDILSIPGYVKGTSNSPIDIGLHSLTRSAGLTLDTVGGTISQAKADAAAGTTLARELSLPPNYGGKTYRQALSDARDQLRANPSWMRLAAGGFLPTDEKGGLAALDQITNLAGDLILLRKPIFTGERLAAGDLAGALKSPYVRAASGFAAADLKEGNVARAAAMLEGGPGAEQLATHAAPLIQDGSLAPEQFRQHVAELLARGQTTLPDGTEINGSLLGSLGSKTLPTPGAPGVAWITAKRGLRDMADKFDASLRDGNVTRDSHATEFIQHLLNSARSSVTHAAPRSARNFYDPGLPEGIRNYVQKVFKDPQLAEQFANDAVKLRATNNAEGLQELDQKLRDLYNEKFPARSDGEMPAGSPFAAALETEAPVAFHFPGGGKREISGDAVDRMTARWQNRAQAVSGALNAVGRVHAKAILSTGFSLAYKHVSDTFRRALAEDGPIFGDTLNGAERADLNAALANPKINRAHGAYLDRNVTGETRWMLNRSGRNVNSVDFATAEHFGNKTHMKAAGGYLRRRLDSEALGGYLESQSNPDALAKVILNNDFFRSRFYKEMGEEVKAARGARDSSQLTLGDLAGAATREQEYGKRLLELARDYAPKIANEFKEFENAAVGAGVHDPWSEAQSVYAANRGAHADAALGKWISDNRINFGVRGGLIADKGGRFDAATDWWITKLMTANKWNRGKLALREFERKYADLRAVGFTQENAASAAMDIGEKLVKYHMLDFSNRLQIEQDLRWISYFATKHRLYWKWVGATLIRRPGTAAVIQDVERNLNGRGQLDFTLFGHKLTLPAARLVWVPGQEYSEFSPLALAGYGLVKGTAETGNLGTGVQQALDSVGGTYGNIFTRQDTTLNLMARLAAVYSGAVPATYGLLTAGLPKSAKDQVDFLANTYQARYMHLHNGQPAPESEVVKYALLHAAGRTFWQAGMPLPVIPQSPQNPDQKEIQAFLKMNDPAQRRRYLEAHPDVASYFGVWTNPADYTYGRVFWSRANRLNAQLESERADILRRAQQGGGWTAALETQYRAASKRFATGYDQLQLEDAQRTGQVVDGQIVTPGKWGKTTNTDPLLTARLDVHNLFPNIGQKELDANVPGALDIQLKAELKLIGKIIDNKGDPQYAPMATDLETLKTRRRDILTQLDAFKGFPTDVASKTHADYQAKFVNPYWQWEEKAYQQIKSLPSGQPQDAAWAKFQAARDARDKPVKVNGVTFPSPVRMAWAMLDPQTRQQRLAKLATGDWSHLTDYEKTLLGATIEPNKDWALSDAWSWYADAVAKWHKESPGESFNNAQLSTLARYFDKYRPGFYKDWLFAQKPKAERFKYSTLYRDMPAAVRTDMGTVLNGAEAWIAAKKANGSAAYYDAQWRAYIQDKFMPWVDQPEQKPLRDWLAKFGPNFLDTLIN